MALRDKLIAGTAALGMAFASVAPVMAQDATPATFSLEGQVYASQVEARNDPAYSDGVIFVGNPDFTPIVIAVQSLEFNGINAAIIADNTKTVSLLFDGRQVNEWSQEDFTTNQARIELTIERLKAAQTEQRADASPQANTPEAG